MPRHNVWFAATSLLVALTTSPVLLFGAPGSSMQSPARPDQTQIISEYDKLSLAFEANNGQTSERVKFLSRGRGYTLFLTSAEAVLSLRTPGRTSVDRKMRPKSEASPAAALRIRLLGPNTEPTISGGEELPGKANYFIGNDPAKWHTNVPTYQRVTYRQIYPGIDLVYYGSNGRLETDFVVRPGADPNQIRYSFQGAGKTEINEKGDLVLHIGDGAVQLQKPVAYQEVNGVRQQIATDYIIKGRRSAAFHVAAYDRSKPLIIDPVLIYSTYLGGSGNDSGQGIAVDSQGSAYVAGFTSSSNFPTTAAFQSSNRGSTDVFVMKLNAAGTGLIYSTYLGGSLSDGGSAFAPFSIGESQGPGIAVDSSGNAYVAGTTASPNFPTAAPLQAPFGGGASDAFLTKLTPSGNGLIYSTFIGGNAADGATGVALDSQGDVYLTGFTSSTNFPTASPLQRHQAGSDAFVTKVHASGLFLLYSTYLGGDRADFGTGIAVDAFGNAYVTGIARSANFPVTIGAFQTADPGMCSPFCPGPSFWAEGFITKINATGTAIVYSPTWAAPHKRCPMPSPWIPWATPM
jgi:hypothetical protein